jgi:CheY-like chemotaxis protein
MPNQTSPLTPPVRILVVDDHPDTAAMLARVLDKFDSPTQVLTARSGEEALQVIEHGGIDILITDFVMRGMSGLDLIEKLKEREPAHTILMTAYDTTALAFTARRLGVQDYLTKPVQPERIREIVANAVRKLRPAQPTAGSSAETAAAPADLITPKILVADDNPDNIRLLTVRLQSEGYTVLTAADGEETLAKLRTDKPDLLMLDINMPKKDGFQVLAEMRSDPEVQHIPVMVVTAARILRQDVREGLMLGADDYITKPFDWREVVARLQGKLRIKLTEDALRRRNRELSLIPEIGQDLSVQRDLEAIADLLLRRTMDTIGAAQARLSIFNPNGSIYRRFHPAQAENTPSGSESLVGEVVVTRSGMIVRDTLTDDRWQKVPGETVRSAAAVPLLGHRAVIGVLVLTHPQPEHFAADQLTVLQAIASQAATIVENTQLLTVEHKRIQELVALNTVTHRISQYSSLNNLFEDLPASLVQAFGFGTAALWSLQGEELTLQRVASEAQAPRASLLAIAPQQAVITQQSAQISGTTEERTTVRVGRSTPPTQSAIAVPLFRRGQVSGAISVHSSRPNAFQESDRVILEILATHIGAASERFQAS